MIHPKWKKCEKCAYVGELSRKKQLVFCVGLVKKPPKNPMDIVRFCIHENYGKRIFNDISFDTTPWEANVIGGFLGLCSVEGYQEIYPELKDISNAETKFTKLMELLKE